MNNKDKLIEKYRYDLVEWDDWYECVYEDFREKMGEVGIGLTNEQMEFTGFCSQGDGARFRCHIDGADFEKFVTVHKLTDVHHVIQLAIHFECDPYIESVFDRSSRYSHENATHIELGRSYDFMGVLASDIEEHDARYIMMEAFDDQWRLWLDDFDTAVRVILRGYMIELYKKLYDEYFALIDDDNVWEYIVANELDKEELDDEEAA